jgi:hypothetical protein
MLAFAFFKTKSGCPEARKPGACFWCPANAIHHEGVPRAVNFYHDPCGLNIVAKLTVDGSRVPAVTPAPDSIP